jgi:hypothetical protein
MKQICRYAVLCLSLIACLPLAGQVLTGPELVGQSQDEQPRQHVGRVLDWSSHHVTLSGGLVAADLNSAKFEPRILYRLVERNLPRVPGPQEARRFGPGGRAPARPFRPKNRSLAIDWSIPLGAGIVAPNMSPAKYSFDINATPDCTKDYVVFGLNVAGATPGQANLVGVNNLYSGAATPRLCLANPTVNWAYNGSTSGGSILTSPVISLDGQRIAYVESTATGTIFHVLTWKAGQGTSATAAVTPTLNGACTGTVPVPTSSCLKSIQLSATATDSLSSPWVDYQTDKAFVGTDDGKIYRISCVFTCGIAAQPAVDWVFTLPVAGTGGAAAKPNGPVYDFPSGRLFVGDQLGELWVINASGAGPTLKAGPVMIGGGGCTTINPPGRTGTPALCTASGGSFGIPDSVIMDSSGASQRIFAFSGNDGTAGASAVVAQLRMDLTGLVRTHVGLGSVGNTTTNVDIHSGTFDNKYFGATPNTGELFVCGTGPANTNPFHYWIGFTSYPVMNATPTGSIARNPTAAGLACSPFTEIFNPNIDLGGGDHDLLISGLMGAGTNGRIITNDISTGAITIGLSNQIYDGGISGVVVDNVSTAGQASSVYFSTQGVIANQGGCVNARCAVKLTQLTLQ